jgi:hypothetical protein
MHRRKYATMTLPDLADPGVAELYLADLLNHGELSLLLGAGVSMSMGLPSWEALVSACESAVKLKGKPNRSARELMEAIDDVRRALEDQGRTHELLELVRSNLYPADFTVVGGYPNSLLTNHMLLAIGALVMSSSRGSVSQVITFNFDDLLEWYLHLHGFTTQVISDFPALVRGDADVTIFHPHGFLPLVSEVYERTSWLVLSHQELVQRLSDETSKWSTLMETIFLSKRFLAVGTSMNDIDVELLLARARRHIPDEPLGFLVAPRSADGTRERRLMEAGVVPVGVESRDAIPEFLLSVCRRAASAHSL